MTTVPSCRFPAKQFTSVEGGVLVVDEVDDSCDRHGSEKINPRLPCNAGQAGKNEATLAELILTDSEKSESGLLAINGPAIPCGTGQAGKYRGQSTQAPGQSQRNCLRPFSN